MISNASPLIVFGSLQRIRLLFDLYGVIHISTEVFDEIVTSGKKKGFRDAIIIESAISEGMIRVSPSNLTGRINDLCNTFPSLDIGEASAISLALTKKESHVLMDETAGRQVAMLYGLHPKGSLRVILEGFKARLISEEELRIMIKGMVEGKFRMSPEILILFWEQVERIKKRK